MPLLNHPAYKVANDNLIYDAKHPIDAGNTTVSLPDGKSGTLKRGQILDYADGVYSIHAAKGTPSKIVAEDTDYAADDTELTVTVYLSGSFRASEVIADPALTAADLEVLQDNGIYLK